MTPLPPCWHVGGIAARLLPAAGPANHVGRCLATLLGCPAEDIVIRRDAGGKPRLVFPPGAAFSVAHRGGVSLVGAAWGGEVGVDLEMLCPDLDVRGIADACFTPAEAGWLRALPIQQRCLGFTALWTVKEAALKAVGQGIVRGMHSPAVDSVALLPLLAGADSVVVAVPGMTGVEVRHGSFAGRPVVACLARAP